MEKNLFFIIGAQRCGTTYLAELLDEHPQIQMARPLRPEPKFFLNGKNIDKGRDYYLNMYFPAVNKEIACGEKSTTYMESSAAGRAIKKIFPYARILVMLRNPALRAISNYFFSCQNNLEIRTPEEVFLEKLSTDPKCNGKVLSTSPFDYLSRGQYSKFLREYFKIFNNSKVAIVFFEEFFQDPLAGLKAIYCFLEVEPSFCPRNLHQKLNQATASIPINVEIMQTLNRYFEPHNQDLAELLGRDLQIWEQK